MMTWLVLLVIACMAVFAVYTGYREIRIYGKYLQGDAEYLVSRKRRNRRLLISFLLMIESAFLFLGFFALEFDHPWQSLLFWMPPLLLIFFLVSLSVMDFRETSRDIDQITKEASETILKKARERISENKQT